MWIADNWKDYEIIDCSKGRSWNVGANIFSSVLIPRSSGTPEDRPWLEKYERSLPSQQKGGGEWEFLSFLSSGRSITVRLLLISSRSVLSIPVFFPEQATNWDWFSEKIRNAGRPVKVLNLFAYTGGATLAAAAAGATVTHVDASREWSPGQRRMLYLPG